MQLIMAPNQHAAGSQHDPPPTSTPTGPPRSRRKTAFRTSAGQKLKLMTRAAPSSVHFPTSLDEQETSVAASASASASASVVEQVARSNAPSTPTIPQPRSSMSAQQSRPWSTYEPSQRRDASSRPSSMYSGNTTEVAAAAAAADAQSLRQIDAMESPLSRQILNRDQTQPTRSRHFSVALPPTSDFHRPRMQPLRDESSDSPASRTDNVGIQDEETPRRPMRRSFGSAGILEAELVRARDREAQAGMSISKVGRSNGAKQNVSIAVGPSARSTYAGSVDSDPSVLEVRIVILGDKATGKTALARRYAEHAFYSANMTATSAAFNGTGSGMNGNGNGGVTRLYTCKAKVHDERLDVKMQIWVVKEFHRSLTKLYYREAHACLITYDITSESSFAEVEAWLQELQGLDTLIYIIGTKSDLAKEGQRRIERRYAREQVYRWLCPEAAAAAVAVAAVDVSKSAPPSAPSSVMNRGNERTRHPSLQRSITIDTPISRIAASPPPETARPRPHRFMSMLPGSDPTHFRKVATLVPSQAVSTVDTDISHRPRRADSMSATSALKRVSMLGLDDLPSSASTSRLSDYLNDSQQDVGGDVKASRRKSEDWSAPNRSRLEKPSLLSSRQSSSGYIDFQDAPSRQQSQSRRSAEIMSRNSSMRGEAPESAATRGEEEMWGRCLRIKEQEIRIGEVSAKANRGVNELFQSITYQLALRKRRIALAEARRARESIYLTDADDKEPAAGSLRGDGRFFGSKGGNCCSA